MGFKKYFYILYTQVFLATLALPKLLGIIPAEDHFWKKGDVEWEDKSGDMEGDTAWVT